MLEEMSSAENMSTRDKLDHQSTYARTRRPHWWAAAASRDAGHRRSFERVKTAERTMNALTARISEDEEFDSSKSFVSNHHLQALTNAYFWYGPCHLP